MIIFDLACTQGHRFEGWFQSSDDFARQQDEQLVRCPLCDDASVARVPSARVQVGKSAPPVEGAPRPAQPPVPSVKPDAAAPSPSPAELITALRMMVRSAEDVGTRFPEEARKMHYEEAPARAIRGQASSDEAEALRDEGIDFASLPPFLLDEH